MKSIGEGKKILIHKSNLIFISFFLFSFSIFSLYVHIFFKYFLKVVSKIKSAFRKLNRIENHYSYISLFLSITSYFINNYFLKKK